MARHEMTGPAEAHHHIIVVIPLGNRILTFFCRISIIRASTFHVQDRCRLQPQSLDILFHRHSSPSLVKLRPSQLGFGGT
jgi:hypothetical protein